MKIGYFSHTNLTISETFIYDLVKGLNQDKALDITYYSGLSAGKTNIDFSMKVVLTGFAEKGERLSYKAYKLGQIVGGNRGYQYKMMVQKNRSYKALQETINKPIDVAYIDYASSAILLREFLNSKKIPFIVHVHGYDITSCLNDPEYVIELKKVIKEAKYFIAASHYMKRLLILQGADEHKIKVIRYGIDTDSIKPTEWKERLKHKPSVIFLGRLTEKKHPIALVHAFELVLKKIPEATLTIIGDGPLKNQVVERIHALKIENSVTLLGSLTREKSFPILNNHWVFAQHSVTAKSGDQEGYALSPAEAAAHELPVVSTLHNGIPEHVMEGVTGYLVPEFNYEAMAEKIIYLLQNPQVAEQMGKAGRINIAKINNPNERIEKIKHLFEDTLKNRM